jgi:DNA recombination protein RmuC
MNESLAALAALAGASLATLITWLALRGRGAAAAERLRLREEELARVSREKLQVDAELSSARARLAASEAEAAARVGELRAAHERLRAEFASLSAEALRVSRDDFLKLATQSFTQLREAAAGDLEARKASISALVQPLRDSLGSVDAKIAEMEKSRASAYGQLGAQLEQLQGAQLRLQAEAAKLSNALSTTRTAGTWGEVQLRRVVELAGMQEHCDFSEQATPDGGGRDRADLLIRLPAGQLIAVDAKAPTEAYREAAAENDPARRAERLAAHAAAVSRHCDDLASREYWTKFEPSPEFVVLFLPGDHFLAAALEADPALMDRSIGRKVLLATPATLIALLKAAAYGWRQEVVSRNAEEVSQLGRQLHDRVATFAEHLEKLGRQLEGAVKAYNSSVGSLEASVLPGARRFAELGARGAKELPALAPIDLQARQPRQAAD